MLRPKKLIAMIVCMAMVFSLLPAVYAEEIQANPVVDEDEKEQLMVAAFGADKVYKMYGIHYSNSSENTNSVHEFDEEYSGIVNIEFDLKVNVLSDGIIAFGEQTKESYPVVFGPEAIAIHTAGALMSRNGNGIGGIAETNRFYVPSKGEVCHFSIVTDTLKHTWSGTMTTESGNEITIADNYGYRTNQDSIKSITLIRNTFSVGFVDDVELTNLKINEADSAIVENVTLDKTLITLTVGGNRTLTATVVPSYATNKNIVWSSSDESVAAVENGVVTAKKAGTATVTAATRDGSKTATCTVMVKEPNILSEEITDTLKYYGKTGGGTRYFTNVYSKDVHIEFDLKINSFSDGIVAFGGQNVAGVFGPEAIAIQTNGVFTARDGNGSGSASNNNFYTPTLGETYHFDITTNTEEHVWSGTMITPDGEEIIVADNYGYRTNQDDIDRIMLVRNTLTDDYVDDIELSNLKISGEGLKRGNYDKESVNEEITGVLRYYGNAQKVVPNYFKNIYNNDVHIEFDLKMNAFRNAGGVIAFGGQSSTGVYGSEAIAIHADWAFEARDGDGNANAASIAFYNPTLGETYHFDITTNTERHVWSGTMTTPDGEEIIIADNYGYRTNQNDIDRIILTRNTADNYYVDDVELTNLKISGEGHIRVSYDITAGSSGSCGDNLTWEVSNKGVLTISGTGEMTSWNWGASPWHNNKNISSVVINEGVANVGSNAFVGCTNIKSVSIPGSAATIESNGFSGCTGLTSITIPDGVTTIGYSAFFACTNLKNIELSNSVTTIEKNAFSSCRSLKSIMIPSGVTAIGSMAFAGCDVLEMINVSEENEVFSSIDGVLFNKNQDTILYFPERKTGKYVIPDSITTIGNRAFVGCALTEIVFPGSIKIIPDYTCAYGHNLTKVTIADSVTEIGSHAFIDCMALTSVSIPDSVTVIGDGAFTGCAMSSIVIPNGVTTIGGDAFSTCKKLQSIKIPGSVTTIGYGAFANCSGLSNAEIQNGVTTIENSAFYNCINLKSVTIPSSVTTIGDNAFAGCSSVISVRYMGSKAEWNKISIGINNECLVNVQFEEKPVEPEQPTEITVNGIIYHLVDGKNLIDNPSFENGTTDGWTNNKSGNVKALSSSGWARSTEYAHDGSYSLKQTGSGGSNSDLNLCRYISIEPGKIYNLTYYEYATKDIAYGRMSACVVVKDQSALDTDNEIMDCGGFSSWVNERNGVSNRDLTYRAGVWTERSYIFDTRNFPDAKYIMIAYAWGDANTLYIDDFKLYEVTTPVTGVSLEKTNITLTVGDTELITATVASGDYTNITWTSSDESVATVANGVVTAKKAGTATITATAGGKSAKCTVTVTNPIIAVTAVTLNKTSTTLTVGDTETLTATVAPSNATNKTVTWKSSNENVATVSSGTVTAVSAGTATITATADGKSASCEVTVKPKSEPAKYTADVNVGKVTARAGETVTIPVTIDNNPGMAGFNLTINYDKTKLTPVLVEKGSVLTVGTLTSNIQQGGDMARFDYVTAYWVNPADVTANGEILKLTFKVAEDADEGDIPVSVTYESGDVTNQNYEDIALNIKNGAVTVKNIIKGDVFADGVVNTKDGVRLSQYLAKWEVNLTASEIAAADVFADGVINTKDGVKLSQYLAKWDVSLEEFSLFGVGKISFKVESVNAKAGEYVDIPVVLTENTGVAGFNVQLNYDKNKLTPVSIEKNLLDGTLTSNIQQGGDMARFDCVTAYWVNPSNITSKGTAFTVRFKIADDADGEIPVTLTYDTNDVPCDQNLNELAVEIASGKVTVESDAIVINDYTVNYLEGKIPANGGSFYAEVSVTKNTDRAAKDIIIIAVYKDGALVDMTYMKSEFAKGQSVVFGGKLTAPKGAVVKALVWDSLDGMHSLGNSIDM